MIEAGVSYTGLDYCQKQIDQFQNKPTSLNRDAQLVFGDARNFDLRESFDLVLIGFSSLSEVVENQDKIKVLQRIHAHLKPSGRFTFSLHNPAARNLSRSEKHEFDFNDGSRTLEFSWRFQLPSSSGIVSGTQLYVKRVKRLINPSDEAKIRQAREDSALRRHRLGACHCRSKSVQAC